jgi:hypothetical protein
MKKIMLSTPAFDGKVHIQYALSFSQTCMTLAQHGIEVQPCVVRSGSLLVAERNRLLEQFWQSDCTHILCIDSDLGWPARAVLAMLETGKEFVAGCYPARSDTENSFFFRPEKNEQGSLIQDKEHKHLIKMDYVPAGFMLISRSVIQKMRDKFPELYYEPKDARCKTENTYCFFNTEVMDGEFWGEDYVFCRKARQAGVDIWVDPLIQFDHAGKVGMLLELLNQGAASASQVSKEVS